MLIVSPPADAKPTAKVPLLIKFDISEIVYVSDRFINYVIAEATYHQATYKKLFMITRSNLLEFAQKGWVFYNENLVLVETINGHEYIHSSKSDLAKDFI